MKKNYFFLLLILAGGFTRAQHTIHDPNAVVRAVPAFHALSVAEGINVKLTQGNEEAVAVSTEKAEDREKVITEVVNGVLHIHFKQKDKPFRIWNIFKKNRTKAYAYVSVTEIDNIKVSSGAKVEVHEILRSDKLGVVVSSGAVFSGELNVADLKATQSSGAVLQLEGMAGRLESVGSSGSVFRGERLEVANCRIINSSGASTRVKVSKALTARVSSGGSIGYLGNDIHTDISSSSGGSVSRIKD